MQLTENFTLDEFIESSFFKNYQKKVWQTYHKNEYEYLPLAQKLANQLQIIRNYFNDNNVDSDYYYAIQITIAFRPLWWEKLQGRNGNSQHRYFKASDIKVYKVHKTTNKKIQVSPKIVYETISYLIDNGEILQGGLGLYDSFVHYDIRGQRARW